MADNKTIKQDINFLEKPLWFPKERNKQTVCQMTDRDGFKFESPAGMPSKVDMLILYYCLLESQNRDFESSLNLSFYKVLTGCGIKHTKATKDRMIESLKRWKKVSIEFAGTFYDKKEYHSMVFGILNHAVVDADKRRVEIEFNKYWLEKIKESNFFKYISFTEMKHLRSPVAIRLYEILSKSFYKREKWTIGAHKLAAKIPLEQKHYSTIKRKIESSINIINEKTDLQIKVSAQKTDKNDGMITFQQVRQIKKQQPHGGQNNSWPEPEPDPEPPELIDDYDAEIERLLQQSGVDRESAEAEFYEKHIKGNPVLSKKYRVEGCENQIIKRTFFSYIRQELLGEGG